MVVIVSLLLYAVLEKGWIRLFLNINLRWLLIQILVYVPIFIAVYIIYKRQWKFPSWVVKSYAFQIQSVELSNKMFMKGQTYLIGYFKLMLFMAILPLVAYIEELIFRLGTQNWIDALYRSTIFGFAHMIIGAPFWVCCMGTLGGLVLSYLYFEGGIGPATLLHFQHNLLMCTILFCVRTVRLLKK